MNLFTNLNFRIKTTAKGEFSGMVRALLKQLPENETILRLVFMGVPQSNQEYKSQYSQLINLAESYCGAKIPAISYISQPPLNGGLTMEVYSYIPERTDTIIYKKTGDCHYILLENAQAKVLIAGGIRGNASDTIEKQSETVFHLLGEMLKAEHFNTNNIVRQWNYIEQITGFEGENQNYQSFNNARSTFYDKAEWVDGYPAATGIGMNYGGVIIDFDAVIPLTKSLRVEPIDNKLQIAAHKYSEEVLEKAQKQKATPKFERAKAITYSQNKFIYISGTAAIRGEESLKDTGLAEQLRITMENIAQLTTGSELRMLRVYLKDAIGEDEIKKLMEQYNPNIPISYVQANVCRTELLIEIEGIAINDSGTI